MRFFATEIDEDGRIPRCVDDAMADLAVVFHWAPADMDQLGLQELMEWRERARVRSSTDGK
jgi:hypothetical protein